MGCSDSSLHNNINRSRPICMKVNGKKKRSINKWKYPMKKNDNSQTLQRMIQVNLQYLLILIDSDWHGRIFKLCHVSHVSQFLFPFDFIRFRCFRFRCASFCYFSPFLAPFFSLMPEAFDITNNRICVAPRVYVCCLCIYLCINIIPHFSRIITAIWSDVFLLWIPISGHFAMPAYMAARTHYSHFAVVVTASGGCCCCCFYILIDDEPKWYQ